MEFGIRRSFQVFTPGSSLRRRVAYSLAIVRVVLVPVIGGLIVGIMARYGSERIRGHGIPEAIEAILLKGARVEPRVAVLGAAVRKLRSLHRAGVAQLVEHQLPELRVVGSSPIARS